MKSLKYDSDTVNMSSYDITAIAYNIDSQYLSLGRDMDLALVEVCTQYCLMLIGNDHIRNSIMVPDGHRAVFSTGHATLDGLAQLTHELVALRNDIMKENERSFTKLSEARVEY